MIDMNNPDILADESLQSHQDKFVLIYDDRIHLDAEEAFGLSATVIDEHADDLEEYLWLGDE